MATVVNAEGKVQAITPFAHLLVLFAFSDTQYTTSSVYGDKFLSSYM